MGLFIVFSGLDCSGKSTQIEILRQKSLRKGDKTLVFWSRGGYTKGFQLLKNLLRALVGKKLPKSGNSVQRDKALSNPTISRIWLTIAMLDLIFYYSIYLRWKSILGYNVICDRYLMDTSIDFKLSYAKSKTEDWILWKILCYCAKKPDFHFVSTIPVSESVIRSKFKYEPFPDSPETLAKRLEIYNEFLKNCQNLIFIDGLRDRNSITDDIDQIIGF